MNKKKMNRIIPDFPNKSFLGKLVALAINLKKMNIRKMKCEIDYQNKIKMIPEKVYIPIPSIILALIIIHNR